MRIPVLPAPALVAPVFIVSLVLAGGTLAAEPSSPPAERLKKIEAEVTSAEAAFRTAWGKQAQPWPASPAVEKLSDEYQRKREAGLDAALEIARSDPASETGFDALAYIMKDVQAYGLPVGKAALELMAKHHAANPKVGPRIARLSYYQPLPNNASHGAAVELLERVAKENPDRTARGQAALGLAGVAYRRFGLAEYEASKDPAKRADVDRAAAEAEKAFDEVVKNYGDCANLRDTGGARPKATLGEEAARELYDLRNLRPGKPAPEIEAEDLDGKKFKLSDYRGKVVVLVFWASWCSPCMDHVPHERKLVERFRGRPFALIGMNGDEEKSAAARAVQQNQIAWRSFWNGPDYRDSPILTSYNVRGWPKVYVIDPRGVIAARELADEQLDKLLESLVSAAEGA
jgi:thiol-disulfide isomerase/thioredoxin